MGSYKVEPFKIAWVGALNIYINAHSSKNEIIILKIDFEKAFDMVEHNAILNILRAKGFPDRWCIWVKQILESATSCVLLNGVLGKDFRCKRGVK